MSIRAAFLLSLIVTLAFDYVYAKRLDLDKLQQIKHGDEGAEQAAMMVEESNGDAAGSALAQVNAADLSEADGLPVTLGSHTQVHARGSAPHSAGMPVGQSEELVNLDRSAVQAVRNVDQGAGLDSIFSIRGGATSEQNDWAAGIERASKVAGGAAAAAIVGLLADPTAIYLDDPVVLAAAAAGAALTTWATLPQTEGHITEEEKEQGQYQVKIASLEKQHQAALVKQEFDKAKKLESEIKSLRSQAKQSKERWAKIHAAEKIQERQRQRDQEKAAKLAALREAKALKNAAMKEDGKAPKVKKKA